MDRPLSWVESNTNCFFYRGVRFSRWGDTMVNDIFRVFSGVLILFVFAMVARTLGTFIPFNELVLAIVFGALVGNTVGVASWFQPGISSYKLWLEVGIVLLGSQMMIQELLSTGPKVLLLVIAVIVFVVTSTEILGRQQGVHPRMRALLGAGIGICGVSAVVAVAGGVRARKEEIAYAVTTILIFDAITLAVYPLIGNTLGLDSLIFGIWAGTTMFSTGPVAAAGFAHSADAGTWAVVSKLVRNSSLGLIVVLFSIRFSSTRSESDGIGWQIWQSLPKFVVGFFVLAIFTSYGLFSSTQLTSLENASQWAFLIAFVGLGFDLQFSKMLDATFTPIFITLVVFLLSSVFTLLSLVYLF